MADLITLHVETKHRLHLLFRGLARFEIAELAFDIQSIGRRVVEIVFQHLDFLWINGPNSLAVAAQDLFAGIVIQIGI